MKKTKLLPVLLLAVLLPSLSSCNESKWTPLDRILVDGTYRDDHGWHNGTMRYYYEPDNPLPKIANSSIYCDILEFDKDTKELRYRQIYVINTSTPVEKLEIAVISISNAEAYFYVERVK